MTGILYSTNANQEIYQKRNYLAMIYIYYFKNKFVVCLQDIYVMYNESPMI